jgi:inosine-uridine nucleoside N-ribohydrolase
MTSEPKPHILAFVDAPDPDNFVQILALAKLNPGAVLHVVLTGRPVMLNAGKDNQTWEWDEESSRLVQKVCALRIKNFMARFGLTADDVFDGGIAPRTLVPHHKHFAEYYKFLDVDPVKAVRHSELKPQEDLVKLLMTLPEKSVMVAVGGPMTGLHQVIIRNPAVASRFKEMHAMFGTWGKVELMPLGDKPRNGLQFNTYCDPQAAHAVLTGLDCPIYIMPTEVTRVAAIGFANADKLKEALPDNEGTQALVSLYRIWYEDIKSRQGATEGELIYIHDLVAAFSLDKALREAIYRVVPVEITSVPYLPRESKDWGKIVMQVTDKPTNVYAADALTEGGPAKYLETLRQICQ